MHQHDSCNARVIDNKILASRKLLKEALKTHPRLHDHPRLIEEAIDRLCGHINECYLSLFIVFTFRCFGVGRYAIMHNCTVDACILNCDYCGLVKEAKRGMNAFPELIENEFLTCEQKETIQEVVELEYTVVNTIIDNYNDEIHGDIEIVSGIDGVEIAVMADDDNFAIRASLYDQCMRMVCVASGRLQPGRCSRTVNVKDIAGSSQIPEIHCFELEDLLKHLARHHGACTVPNYQTGKNFSDDTLADLRCHYDKEIAIYRYVIKMANCH